jgi:hypothetical protein
LNSKNSHDGIVSLHAISGGVRVRKSIVPLLNAVIPTSKAVNKNFVSHIANLKSAAFPSNKLGRSEKSNYEINMLNGLLSHDHAFSKPDIRDKNTSSYLFVLAGRSYLFSL